MRKMIINFVIILMILVSCSACNGQTNTKEFCSYCGKEISQDVSYCEQCGEELKEMDEKIEEDMSNNVDAEGKIENNTEEKADDNNENPNKSNTGEITNEKTTVENAIQDNQRIEEPSTSKTPENITPTPDMPQNPNIEDFERKYFQQLYENEREIYVLSVSRNINSLELELLELRNEASEVYGQYIREKEAVKEKFASMGMLNSGAYKAEIERLDNDYKNTSASYTKRITDIENQIAVLEKEQQNPSTENILKQLAINNNMTFDEALRKYNKYVVNS